MYTSFCENDQSIYVFICFCRINHLELSPIKTIVWNFHVDFTDFNLKRLESNILGLQ